MSASRDRTAKVKFVYSNLYELYRTGKTAALQSDGFQTGQVIRKETFQPGLKVERFQPAELKQVLNLQAHPVADQAVSDLKKNLDTLNDLQSRMQFMLKEIEDLLKPKS